MSRKKNEITELIFEHEHLKLTSRIFSTEVYCCYDNHLINQYSAFLVSLLQHQKRKSDIINSLNLKF